MIAPYLVAHALLTILSTLWSLKSLGGEAAAAKKSTFVTLLVIEPAVEIRFTDSVICRLVSTGCTPRVTFSLLPIGKCATSSVPTTGDVFSGIEDAALGGTEGDHALTHRPWRHLRQLYCLRRLRLVEEQAAMLSAWQVGMPVRAGSQAAKLDPPIGHQ